MRNTLTMTRKRYWDRINRWLTFEQAKKKVDDSLSSFVLLRRKRHVVLPPRFLGRVHEGIREWLNSELRMFSTELSGVVIDYNNISMVQMAGNIYDESPFLHFDIEADFIVFRPTIGCSIKGKINKIGDDHIGCLIHNCVNASIPLPGHLVQSGKFSGSDSSVVTSDVDLEFEVTDLASHNRILTITGKLKTNSLQHINLTELQTKPVPAEGLGNGCFKVENSEFEYLRLASHSRESGMDGHGEREAGKCGDGRAETGTNDNEKAEITGRDHNTQREKTDSDLVSCSDSSSGRKRKKKRKKETGEDVMKTESLDTLASSGLSSSFCDSGVDVSFLGRQLQEKPQNHNKVKKEPNSPHFVSPVNSSTPLSPKKHKHKSSSSSNKNKLETSSPKKHKRKTPSPKRHTWETPSPKKPKLTTPPKQHKLKPSSPKQHKTPSPKKHKLEIPSPEKHKLEIPSPEKHKLEIPSPKKHRSRRHSQNKEESL